MRSLRTLLLILIVSVSACVVPTPAPAPAPARSPVRETVATSHYGRMESRILTLVNAERRQRGLRELALNPRLDQAAKLHARNMATFRKMAHVLPESRLPTLTHRAQYVAYPYATIAENIALGYSDAESVVKGWMASPGHRRNILNPEVAEIGTGIVSSTTGGLYFCQVFGKQLTSI